MFGNRKRGRWFILALLALLTVLKIGPACFAQDLPDDGYDYLSALEQFKADYVKDASRTFDAWDGPQTLTLIFTASPFIKNGGVYGAHVLMQHKVFNDKSEFKGQSRDDSVMTWNDAKNPGQYMTLGDLRKKYPAFEGKRPQSAAQPPENQPPDKTPQSKEADTQAMGTWDIYIGGLVGSANENTPYYHAILIIKKEESSYSGTIKFDTLAATEKLNDVSYEEGSAGKMKFTRPPLLSRKNDQYYRATIKDNKLTGTFSDKTADGKVIHQKWWSAGSAAGNPGELIAVLKLYRPGLFRDISNDILEEALKSKRTSATGDGPTVNLEQGMMKDIREFTQLLETPLASGDKSLLNSNRKTDEFRKQLWEFLDQIKDVLPEAYGQWLGVVTFFKKAHEKMETLRDAYVIPAVAEKAYAIYKSHRGTAVDASDISVYDTYVASSAGMELVRSSPGYTELSGDEFTTVFRQHLEARYQLERFEEARQEMVKNKEKLIGQIVGKYDDKINVIHSACEELMKK